jgi:heme o synthase
MGARAEGLIFRANGGIKDYWEVTKPRETALLVFLGVVSALLAGGGPGPAARMGWVFAALLLASAGANGLTNYLDRGIDARMPRTAARAIPAGRIYPAERALFFSALLCLLGLVLAWGLHPLVFAADLVGTATALVYRKRVTCVFPQGVVASCTPVLMGWWAVSPNVGWELLLLCGLIALWLPAHIWSIMLFYREDYCAAGISYFPLSRPAKTVNRLLLLFSVLLYACALGLFFVARLGPIYLATVNIAGPIVIAASIRLMRGDPRPGAWRLYKISAFPLLGVLFLSLALSVII